MRSRRPAASAGLRPPPFLITLATSACPIPAIARLDMALQVLAVAFPAGAPTIAGVGCRAAIRSVGAAFFDLRKMFQRHA